MIHKIFYVRLLALLLISIGLTILFGRLWIYDLLISSVFVLSPNSLIYEFWKKPPITVKTHFYLYNWTNPEEIFNLSSKPRFQQMGPYVFVIKPEKVNITWNENNTVTFRIWQRYYFDETDSKGKLTDMITTLNTVTASAAHKLRYESYLMKKSFSVSLAVLSPGLHIIKSAGQLLFDGYEDPYVDIGHAFPFLKDDSPDLDRAGFLYMRNNSYTIDGTYSVATDVNRNAGEVIEWNYRKNIVQHEGYCSKLGGSVGDFYPQKRTKDYIKMFIADTCKNYKLDFEEEVLVEGIDGYKYSARHSTLDNGTIVPENKCYCGGECVPSGVMNLTSCSYGAPAFLSLPHFYGADPFYLDKVEGLKPEKSKHEMFVTLEPRLGLCIDIALRLQVNFLLHPVEYITMFEDVPTVFVPILWTEQRVTIPNNFAIFIKIFLSTPNVIVPIAGVMLIVFGLLLVRHRLCKYRKKLYNFAATGRINIEEKLFNHTEQSSFSENNENEKNCIY